MAKVPKRKTPQRRSMRTNTKYRPSSQMNQKADKADLMGGVLGLLLKSPKISSSGGLSLLWGVKELFGPNANLSDISAGYPLILIAVLVIQYGMGEGVLSEFLRDYSKIQAQLDEAS